jgi:hypothetical protein
VTDYTKWQNLLRERVTEGTRGWVAAEAHRTGVNTLTHQRAFSRVRLARLPVPGPVACHRGSPPPVRPCQVTTTPPSPAAPVVRPRPRV